jgi:hypothetical protein
MFSVAELTIPCMSLSHFPNRVLDLFLRLLRSPTEANLSSDWVQRRGFPSVVPFLLRLLIHPSFVR